MEWVCAHRRLSVLSKYRDVRGVTRVILRCRACPYELAEEHWWEGAGSRMIPKIRRFVVSTQNVNSPKINGSALEISANRNEEVVERSPQTDE